jgi:glucose-1-phosphate thymidylyltransferase
LGENIFCGNDFVNQLLVAHGRLSGATVFAYHVRDPEHYGAIELHAGHALSIEEKPVAPKSNWAVTGLHFYDDRACDIARDVQESARGELEITDVNRHYLERGQLHVQTLGRRYAWLDTGTHDSLQEAASFIATLQRRQGMMVACPEEVALLLKWIGPTDIERLARPTRAKCVRPAPAGLDQVGPHASTPRTA